MGRKIRKKWGHNLEEKTWEKNRGKKLGNFFREKIVEIILGKKFGKKIGDII